MVEYTAPPTSDATYHVFTCTAQPILLPPIVFPSNVELDTGQNTCSTHCALTTYLQSKHAPHKNSCIKKKVGSFAGPLAAQCTGCNICHRVSHGTRQAETCRIKSNPDRSVSDSVTEVIWSEAIMWKKTSVSTLKSLYILRYSGSVWAKLRTDFWSAYIYHNLAPQRFAAYIMTCV